MKTFSLLAPAAALSLGLAVGAPADAAPYKPNTGPNTTKPGPLAAIKYLKCEGLLGPSVRVTNNSGVMLKAGTAIHVGYTVNNQQKQVTKYLAKDLPNGGSVVLAVGPYQFHLGCTAQANLIASPSITITKPPIPGRPGPGSGPKPY
jgi:hypothetical protein